jgi:Calx-beta domain/Subtilase family/Bacterial pre-peptidase C-terminal domain/Viral BACON domain
MIKLLTIFMTLSLVAFDFSFVSHGEAKNPRRSPRDKHNERVTSKKLAPQQQQMQELSETTKEQLQALIEEKQSRSAVQQKLDSQLLLGAKIARQESLAPAITSMNIQLESDTQGRNEVDIRAEVTDNLLETIVHEGGEVVNSYPQFKAIRAYLPPQSLETIAGLSEVRFINQASQAQLSQAGSAISSSPMSNFPERVENVKEQLTKVLPAVVSSPPETDESRVSPSIGTVNSEGDITHAADQARASFNINGSGVKIGVISDSVKGLAQSQASGNLPNVTVLAGRSGVDGSEQDTGEGTAMLEIVYDLAPGAQLYFSTDKGGPSAMAQNILDLQAAGCNIIVDDVEYFDESPFQDAVIARAVNTVTAAGVLYFSSAGNSGNLDDSTSSVWEGDFVDGGSISSNGTIIGNAHRFASPNVIFNQAFTQNTHAEQAFLFWSDPLAAANDDYDLYVVNSSGMIVRSANNTQSGTQDPVEHVVVGNGEYLLVVKFSGANRYLHLNVGRGTFTYATAGRTKGHSAAADAFSVAAVKAGTSYPHAFTGGDRNPVETFSSDGPRRIFFNPDGSAITPGNFSSTGGTVRAKPDITAADGVSTSVPDFTTFFGTSAAAPHAAAIAALLLSYKPSLTPTQVRTALTSTALDIEGVGADRDSGAGIVMALQALQAVSACPGVPIAPNQTVNGTLTTSDCFFVGTTQYVDIYTFSGTAGQQIAISMSSSAFDSYLYLIDSTNHVIAENDDGGGGNNSRIPATSGFFTLPTTGTFKIYATSFGAGSTGAYSLTFTVSNCSFSLNPTSQIFISSASTGSFAVSASSGCSWTAISNASWLTTSSSGVGNGTVNYSVAANFGNSRTGLISVGGQNFTVFQSAGNGNGCPSTALTPGQVVTATLTTGCVFTGTSRYVNPYTFNGTAGQQIAITMSSTAFDTYLFMDSPNNQTIARDDDGGGGTNSRIPANAGFFTLPTSGTYTIYATSFSADGTTGSTGSYTIALFTSTTCTYALNPTSQSVGAASSSSSFTITTQSGCAWTALSNASWLVTSSSGTGNGTINYSIGTNVGIARTGTISVAGLLFTVNQSAGSGSTIQFSSGSYSAGEAAGVVNITVTRSNPTGASVVTYATANGTAKEGRNYIAANGILSFAAGETSKTFPVLIIDNAFVDGARTVNLALSTPVNATLGSQGSAILTVNDNDVVIGANPVDQQRPFVQFHYYDFFGRYPDQSGWDFWTNTITSCGANQSCTEVKRINASGAFFLSIEFQETGYLVYRIYKSAFGNITNAPVPIRFEEFLPDLQQIGSGVIVNQGNWQAQLEANKVAFTQSFVQRSRFITAFPTTMTPAAFVDQLFSRAGVTPSAADRNAAIAEFGSATNTADTNARARALRDVAENSILNQQEVNRAFVLMQYFGYLRRNPYDAPEPTRDYGGYNFWLAKLNQFKGDYIAAEMVKAFIASDEYRHRFGP